MERIINFTKLIQLLQEQVEQEHSNYCQSCIDLEGEQHIMKRDIFNKIATLLIEASDFASQPPEKQQEGGCLEILLKRAVAIQAAIKE